jgi:hypothetical protein
MCFDFINSSLASETLKQNIFLILTLSVSRRRSYSCDIRTFFLLLRIGNVPKFCWKLSCKQKCSVHYSVPDHSSNTCSGIQCMKLLVVRLSPPSSYVIVKICPSPRSFRKLSVYGFPQMRDAIFARSDMQLNKSECSYHTLRGSVEGEMVKDSKHDYRRPPLWSSGQSSSLQIRRPAFDFRHYQIF